jgi:hypothetical protein
VLLTFPHVSDSKLSDTAVRTTLHEYDPSSERNELPACVSEVESLHLFIGSLPLLPQLLYGEWLINVWSLSSTNGISLELDVGSKPPC